MTSKKITLTPAQTAFLTETVPWFNARAGAECAGLAGSERRFIRIVSGDRTESCVLVVWNSADNDWHRFIAVQRDVSATVPFLPRISAYDDRHGLIVEEDLGALTLKKFCDKTSPERFAAAYRLALDALASWQRIDPGQSAVISSRAMDKDMFLWESEYFAEHCVAEFCGLDALLTKSWERERRRIAEAAAGFSQVCIHRDFQSENILLHNGAVRFVDYQGARLGPAAYDVASLLHDPYVARLTPVLSKKLFEYYRSVAPLAVSPRSFRICSIQRLMQALGAYGNLSIHKGKDWYRAYVPVALRRLAFVLAGRPSFPELSKIANECIKVCGKKRLTVNNK